MLISIVQQRQRKKPTFFTVPDTRKSRKRGPRPFTKRGRPKKNKLQTTVETRIKRSLGRLNADDVVVPTTKHKKESILQFLEKSVNVKKEKKTSSIMYCCGGTGVGKVCLRCHLFLASFVFDFISSIFKRQHLQGTV